MNLLRIPVATAATPLLAITAISVDTEATSLDLKSSRVIEIGAVALVNGVLREDFAFETLINPNSPIPTDSTKIHGLRDQDVVDAVAFSPAWKSFKSFALHHILIGYSLDFDLMLLEREHGRANVTWKAPAALDVRSLIRFLRPTLPDYALETVASWLGVAIENRHRAKGDAVLTARVLLAIVPLLREKNIRTLGEAIAACQRVEQQNNQNALPLEASGRLQTSAIARADSFPYRHRVADVMAVPALKISPDTVLADAMNVMVERKVSSLFVDGGKSGILTERDLLRALAAGGAKAFTLRVGDVATFPLRTVAAEDFIYVAMGLMRRLRIRHLGVTDENGTLVGALSQRDLLKLRADEALALTNALSDAATPSELAMVWRKLADAARALAGEDVDARDIAAIISSEVCALTARAAQIAEAEFIATKPEGLDFAVLVLGSGGRGESLLALDQDNALIFTCSDEAAAQKWLERFAIRLNDLLDEIGVPLCKGGVMARNLGWRMSLAEWHKQISQWLSRSDPADILNADIFFDSVCVYGHSELADSLRDHAVKAASQAQAFLKLMSLKAIETGTALNWLGRFATDENNRFDLKRLGIMPIFSAARVVALRYQIHERSTRGRLAALRGNPDVPQHVLEAMSEAHGILMGFILRQQLEDLENGTPLSNNVAPGHFSALERERLKWALKQIPNVADIVGAPLAG